LRTLNCKLALREPTRALPLGQEETCPRGYESLVEFFEVKMKAKTKGESVAPSPKAEVTTAAKIEAVLVPTDFSEESLKAIAYGRALLNHFPGSVHLVYVHDIDFAYAVPALMSTSPLIATEEVERRYRKDLEKLAKQFDLQGSTPQRHVRTGRAYHEICDVADGIGAQLIVIATHGRTGLRRLIMGSTAERVVRHAPCPVLVVRETERDCLDGNKGETATLHISKVLVPVDFSESSLEGLLYAISFAKRFGASLILLHAIQVQPFIPAEGHTVHERMPAPGVIERAARLRARKFLKQIDFVGVEYEMEIQSGQPAPEICRYAENADVDLIITSTHGQTGLAHALIGSTAEHVVRYAHCPVLVVPTTEASAERQRDVRKGESKTEERS